MKIDYYPDTDSLYIDLSSKPSVESQEVSTDVVLDFDVEGNVVGIDIDHASRKFDLRELITSHLPLSPKKKKVQPIAHLELETAINSGKGKRMRDHRLYVEKRPRGDFAVRKSNSERASAVAPTQAEAIKKARELNPGTAPHVERVRNTSAGGRDKWRKP